MGRLFTRFTFISYLISNIVLFLGSPQGMAMPVNPPKIVILQTVEHPALNATRQGILDALQTEGYAASFESAQGNPALAQQIAQKFLGHHPNVVIGIGTTAAQALAAQLRNQGNQAGPVIPLIFSSVTDPVGAGLVQNLAAPGGNITGVSNYVSPEKQFAAFKKHLPQVRRLGIIYNPGEANSVTLKQQMEIAAPQFGLTLVFKTANNTSQVVEATRSLLTRVDAIFVNNDNTALAAFESIVKLAKKHQLPVLVSDLDMLDQGATAAIGPNQYEIGSATGKIVIELLKGKMPGNIPVVFPTTVEYRTHQ